MWIIYEHYSTEIHFYTRPQTLIPAFLDVVHVRKIIYILLYVCVCVCVFVLAQNNSFSNMCAGERTRIHCCNIIAILICFFIFFFSHRMFLVELYASLANKRLPRESMMFINYQIGHHRATVVVRLMSILFELCALYIC